MLTAPVLQKLHLLPLRARPVSLIYNLQNKNAPLGVFGFWEVLNSVNRTIDQGLSLVEYGVSLALMAQRDIPFVQNEFYHVYNRGNSKQNIFLDGADYRRFQDLLYLANSTEPAIVRYARRGGVYEVQKKDFLVAIGAYCLMPNHFHILLTPVVDGGISTFMKKVATGYAMYFNKRYERTGSLFEGKFRAKHASTDTHLKYLYAYIHLNPLRLTYRGRNWKEKAAVTNDVLIEVSTYPYSSYQDYTQDVRNESMILSKEFFPEYFIDKSSWDREMLDWIRFKQF